MKFIDTHCHLFWEDFHSDLSDVLARARAVGVDRIIIPATTIETMQQAMEICAADKNMFCTAGVHPHDTSQMPEGYIDTLRKAALNPCVVAIGEIGLDYHYDFSPKEKQQKELHAQLALAKELGLPVVLHNRESDEDLLALCAEHQDGTLRGQFHCFSSSPDYAEKVLALGFHVSFTGNVTFKKSTLADALRLIPDDRLLIETDAPFMSPVPYRGKRNEPSYIPLIAEKFAEIRGQSLSHIAEITTRNAEALFFKPSK